MITDLTPYAAYKESGLPWLGQVPRHWEVRAAFGAFVPNHERNHGMKEKTVLSLSYGRIIIKPAEKLHGLVPESFETYQIVNPGDIVLRTTDLQNDHTSLRVGMVRDRGIITSAYLALRVTAGVDPDFGFQFLNVWDMSKAIYGYGSGLRQNLDFSHFKRMPVAVPPLSEQAAIVRFLDWANGRLERTIRAKRMVIALLNEQKQGIIRRAVTRGLDASVPLKPSGIPWLGDIPQHWEMRKLRQVLERVTERNRSDLPLLSVAREKGVIKRDTTNLDENHNFIPDDLSNYKVVRIGQFAMNKMKAWQGSYGVSDDEGIVSPAYFVFKVHGVNAEFFHVAIRSKAYVPFFTQASDGVRVGQWDLAEPRMKEISFFFPPLAEQQTAIVRFINDATANISIALSRLDREIELLQEYRTRLVADVVTGKLDVREAAVRLPEEIAPDTAQEDAALGLDSEGADEEAIV
ncbi:MAG: restriction endonuclease subunit S [Burkholderiales bacterium]|nr:restriction endonuclease subunit S [Burkholderiales bacterium]